MSDPEQQKLFDSVPPDPAPTTESVKRFDRQSKIVGVRLSEAEQAMLAFICESRDGSLNPSEKIRQLIHREYNRRTTGRSVVDDNAIRSDWRTGRPSADA